jgi:hypothetical protein
MGWLVWLGAGVATLALLIVLNALRMYAIEGEDAPDE